MKKIEKNIFYRKLKSIISIEQWCEYKRVFLLYWKYANEGQNIVKFVQMWNDLIQCPGPNAKECKIMISNEIYQISNNNIIFVRIVRM